MFEKVTATVTFHPAKGSDQDGKSDFPTISSALDWVAALVTQDTDTFYIELRQAEIIDTRDLDEDTILDLDRDGHVCAITIEHARERTEISPFSYQQVPA